MDCLQIDWDNIDHTFVRDEFYENIQAPKWIDFTAPLQPIDDFEWFCAKSGCTHHDKKIDVYQDIHPLQKSTLNVPKKPVNVIAFGGKKGRAMGSSVSSISEIKESFAKNRVIPHHSKMVSDLKKNVEKKPRTFENLQDHSKRSRQPQQQLYSGENENPNKVQGGLSKVPTIGKAPELMLNKKMKMFSNKSEHAVVEASGILPEGLQSSERVQNIPREASDGVAPQKVRNPGGESAVISRKVRNPLGESSDVSQKARNIFGEASGGPRKIRQRIGLDVASKYSSSTTTTSTSSSIVTIGCKRQEAGGKRNMLTSSTAFLKRSNNVESTTTTMRSMHSLHLGSIKATSSVQYKAASSRVVALRKEDKSGFRVALLKHEKINLPQVVRKVPDSRRLGLSAQSREDSQNSASSSSSLSEVEVVNDAQGEEEALEMSLQLSLMSLNLLNKDAAESVRMNEKESHWEESREEMEKIVVSKSEGTLCAKGRDGHSVAEEMLAIKMESNDNVARLLTPKKWKKTQGTKRKSAELNFKVNCSSKEHKVLSNTRPLFSSTCYHQNQLLIKKSPTKGAMNRSMIINDTSCKEQHKKLKSSTIQPSFKPFRFRTEERIALKENGFGKKEEQPNQDVRHHALRMPSFSQPFRPQRSSKKLTVPKEPKFHLSKGRRACTKQAAMPTPTTTT